MKNAPILAFALLTALGVGCSQRVSPESAPTLVATPSPVEAYWPDGGLRLRKQVLLRGDGTLVDHGSFERWHENGQKEYEAVFVQGRKEGTTVRYHRNGQRSTQQEYRNGKRHGPSVSWNADGSKVKEENWADGRPHGTWTIWKDGRVQWSHTFEYGVPDSVAKSDERN
jgi:hypothetical protein